MVNRLVVIGFLIGLVFGIISMVLFRKSEPDQKPETKVYDVANNRLKERIKNDSVLILKLRTEKDTIIKEIYRDRTFYKTIYEKIPFSNSVDRINAFDTLLTK
jgi:uncharacterized membrane-anchored protein YhcB (DUF1043 family)